MRLRLNSAHHTYITRRPRHILVSRVSKYIRTYRNFSFSTLNVSLASLARQLLPIIRNQYSSFVIEISKLQTNLRDLYVDDNCEESIGGDFREATNQILAA